VPVPCVALSCAIVSVSVKIMREGPQTTYCTYCPSRC
jgi:hypothetical protein